MSPRITPLVDPEAGASGRRLAWLACRIRRGCAGSAFLRLFGREGQEHLAELEIAVHGAERRRGVGTRLLDIAVAAARADGRRSVLAQAEQGSPADLFLAARGFCHVLGLTYARLPLAAADLVAMEKLARLPHPGYRLTEWDGTVPPALARSFADARRAMDDMPMDDVAGGLVDFLTAASAEFAAPGVVRTARRSLATIEGADPVLFVGVELATWDGAARPAPGRPRPRPRHGARQAGRSTSSSWTWPRTRSATGCGRGTALLHAGRVNRPGGRGAVAGTGSAGCARPGARAPAGRRNPGVQQVALS
ncbi:hypothetical protein SGLAM104S_09371 [Streptomyces glaucescens]